MHHRIRTTSKRLVATALLAALLFAVELGLAQSKAPRAPAKSVNKTTAAERTYSSGSVHLEKSRIYVHVGKTGLGHEHGVVGQLLEGTIHLGGLEAADKLVFDMASFDADGDAARKYVGLEGPTDASMRKQVNKNLLGPSVLNVTEFPTATFEIKSLKQLVEPSERDLPQCQIAGKFTLHGTTKPLTVLADVEETGEWIHLRGSFSILQSDYGITPYSKAFGAVGVADRLQIWGDFWIAN